MDISTWLTAIGWVVAPLIALKTNQIVKERTKIVTWSVLASDFFNDDHANRIGQSLGSKIQILIDGKFANHVSYVSVSFQNTTNKKLKNIRLHFGFGKDACLYKYQLIVSKPVYSDDIKEFKRWYNAIDLDVMFLDKNQVFTVIFLLANHHPKDVFVEGKCEEDEVKVMNALEAANTFKGFSTTKIILFTLPLIILINSLTPNVISFIENLTQHTN